MKDTSRTAALDYLLALGNLIALADHKEEQIINLNEELQAVDTVASTQEEADQMTWDIIKEIWTANKTRQQLYDFRKELQRNFFEIYDIDMDYRCQMKHYAVALTAMEECRNANPTVQNDILLQKFRTHVYQFLGIAMWVGPANCWRCLADALDEAAAWVWKVIPGPGGEVAQIFNPKDYSGSEINYIDEAVVIPEWCWRHEEYREWDWWKVFRCAVKDWCSDT